MKAALKRLTILAALILCFNSLIASKRNSGAKRGGLGKKVDKKDRENSKRDVLIEVSSTADSKNVGMVAKDMRTDILRMKARKFLAKQDYNRAANCYAGILQVNEGSAGFEAGELRRRCCLTLAECEIKVGNLEHAISLCTEVIDEMTVALDACIQSSTSAAGTNDTSDSSEKRQLSEIELKDYLGKAYYRRGVSLARLDHHELAMLDLQEAHLYLPEDELILDRIVAVQGRIDDRDRVEEEDDDDVVDLDNTGGGGYSRGEQPPPSEEELKERLLDVVEQAQIAEARYLSEEALKVLATEERAVSPLNMGGMPGLQGAGTGAGGLGDIFGAMGGMGGAGAGAGGLGALMGGLGGAGKKGKLPSLDSITAMLPMLGGMAGLSPDTIASGKEVLNAISHVGKVFYGIFKKVAPFKDLLFAVVAGVLIFISTRSGS